MTDLNRTLIVTAADVDAARNTGAAFTGGTGMFSVQLTTDSTGAPPATSYGCSGWWPEEIVNSMWPSACVIQDADAEPVFATLARLGLHMVQEPV